MEGVDLSTAAWRKSRRSSPNGASCVEIAAVWRKSRRSSTNGANCVEVAPAWRKSRRSGTNGTECVEVAAADRRVAVRDSKDRSGPVLAFTADGWTPFTAAVKAGRFDA